MSVTEKERLKGESWGHTGAVIPLGWFFEWLWKKIKKVTGGK
jgi:hypothetical protein